MPRRESGRPLFIESMHGLGDACYQRPFIRAQSEVRPVYLQTCWPELFEDLPNVHPVRPRRMPYRTQAKHLARLNGFPWAKVPADVEKAHFTYCLLRGWTILEELERHVGLAARPLVFDLPDFGPSPVKSARPVAVIRPVTTRAEWVNVARAPLPEYVAQAARVLTHAGYHVVAVADIDPPHEWLEGEMPPADDYFVRGELPPRELFALMQHAAVVVGGSGFVVPAALALGTPLVIIGGGQGGHNAPEIVTDPRIDFSHARWVLPDDYCRCRDKRHACDKRIDAFPQRFRSALLEAATPQKRRAA